MAFPITNYSRVWVRGKLIDLAKAAREVTNYGATGPVQFIPTPTKLVDSATKQVINPTPIVVYPAATDGSFAIQLPATDDPDINPTAWNYKVVPPFGDPFYMVVPYNTGTLSSVGDPLNGQQVLELSSVVPDPDANGGLAQVISGVDGRGISSMAINGSDHLIVTYDDSTTQDAGAVPVATGDELFFVVTQHGATGDGTTDDTTAINATVTAANAAGGGVVYFPPGTYIISAPIVGKDKVRFQGASQGSAILKAKSTFAPTVTDGGGLIQWQGSPFDSSPSQPIYTHVGVSDVTIDMSLAPDTVENQINGIWQDYCQIRHVRIERVRYIGAKKGQGILFNGLGRITGGNSYDITIKDISTKNGGGTISLYLNAVTDATATYHGVTIDNIWNEITTISGLIDDRVVIAGGHVSDAGSSATVHDINISNVKVVIQTGATVTGLVHGIKIDTGKAVNIRNVTIRDTYMWGNGSTTVSGHPIVTFLGGQTGTLGGLQDILIDGVYAWHTCGVAVKWRRVDTAPSVIIRNVHINGAVTGSTGWPFGIMVYCLSAPVGDETVLIDGVTMDATSGSMTGFGFCSDTPTSGTAHGASGLVSVKNALIKSFATGISLAKDAAGSAATQSGWDNLCLEDVVMVSQTTAASLLSKTYRSRNVTGVPDTNYQYVTDLPSGHGFIAWNFDPCSATGTNQALTSGSIYLARITPQVAATISSIGLAVVVAGTSLTSSQNLAAIYDSSGNRVALTSDQTTAWGTTGFKTCSLTSSVSLTAGADYYVAVLSVGSTPITLARGPASLFAPNAGLSAASLRFALNGTSQTSLPTTRTLSSNTATNAIGFWCALS